MRPIQFITFDLIYISDYSVTFDFALQADIRSQAREQRPVRRVHVDTTQLDRQNHKFELSVVQPPNDYSADKTKYYQLKQLEHSPQDMKVIFPWRVLPEKKMVEICCSLPNFLTSFRRKSPVFATLFRC